MMSPIEDLVSRSGPEVQALYDDLLEAARLLTDSEAVARKAVAEAVAEEILDIPA